MPETETKPEQQTNCLSCNKPLRRKKTYYRNGKYYCAKKCYKAFLDKQNADKEQNEAQ